MCSLQQIFKPIWGLFFKRIYNKRSLFVRWRFVISSIFIPLHNLCDHVSSLITTFHYLSNAGDMNILFDFHLMRHFSRFIYECKQEVMFTAHIYWYNVKTISILIGLFAHLSINNLTRTQVNYFYFVCIFSGKKQLF